MFLVLLSVTLVVSYGDVNNTEPYIILRNKDKCRMEAEFRKIMDKQHNLLRQQVAFGHTYLGKNFTSQEMCGLVYDCGIEEKARKELYYPGSISDRYDVMYFERPKTSSIYIEVVNAIQDLVHDEEKLQQITNPKATAYGCWGHIFRFPRPNGPLQVEFVCLYDNGEPKKQQPTGKPCSSVGGVGCTFYPNSTCLWGLCYVLNNDEKNKIKQFNTSIFAYEKFP
ncbi:hypothetical protein RB195_004437 [Necator americanus]|uniref:SCP domain-containing protein n=1 Tax=Necator americanus TaxID=51031 RepID=A0ABR1BHZ4_NECAM